MIQDINGKQEITYVQDAAPAQGDAVLHFKGRDILVREGAFMGGAEAGGKGLFPIYEDMSGVIDCRYIFTMTGRSAGKYFLCLDDEIKVPAGFGYVDIRELRRRLGKGSTENVAAEDRQLSEPHLQEKSTVSFEGLNSEFAAEEKRLTADTEMFSKKGDERGSTYEEASFGANRVRFASECFNAYDEVYAAFTAFHLDHWYRTSRYCGRCGKRMIYGKKERMMECPDCGNQVYPRINPAVIVGVISPDHKKLLVTKYARSRGVKVNALVAGFTEIGETFEDTVRREVMEEVGLRVKNIRYYKSQPWGIADDILAGFYCEAEQGQEVHLDTDELRSAVWQSPEEITGQPDNLSLTNEMMIYFKEFWGR